MDEQPGLSDQYRQASPWPLFIALGLALSEVGVVLDIVPISVGGLLLFFGSIVGIIQEAGYAESPWPIAAGIGVLLLVVGGALDFVYRDAIAFRGLAIAITGALFLVGAAVGKVRQRESF